jgi:hypothetical protein
MAAIGGPNKNGATRTIRLDTPQYPTPRTKTTKTPKVKLSTGRKRGRGANLKQKG